MGVESKGMSRKGGGRLADGSRKQGGKCRGQGKEYGKIVIFIPSHLDPGLSLVVGDFQSSDEDLAVPYPENLKSFFKNWCFCHPVKDLANNIIKISL